jgi:hypothetical protein
LRQGGKINLPAWLNAVAAGMLVHVECQLTARRYLVDTGASFSLATHKYNKKPARRPRLMGPNGQIIKCWGEEQRQLRLSGRLLEWPFLKSAITFPILGGEHHLSVEVANNRSVDSANGDTFSLIMQPSGYTTSLMMPASVLGRRAKAAKPQRAGRVD